MVRKSPATPYTSLTAETASSIVFASSGKLKNKDVDPRRLIGAVHVKKYLAENKINGKEETWIAIVKNLLSETPVELTPEQAVELEACKVATREYLDTEASAALVKRVEECDNDLKKLKDVASSMKFKFSRLAFEVIAHALNLMVREVLTFTCDSAGNSGTRLTRLTHIPWDQLRDKPLAGLYINTKAAFDAINVVDTEASEEEVVKPRLAQYISNTFKEITTRDSPIAGMMLGKEIISLLNDIVFQTMDRFANVIKSLLDTASSKTVNERLAIIAVKILLQDHMHSSDADVGAVLDALQERLEEAKVEPEEPEEGEEPTEDEEAKTDA